MLADASAQKNRWTKPAPRVAGQDAARHRGRLGRRRRTNLSEPTTEANTRAARRSALATTCSELRVATWSLAQDSRVRMRPLVRPRPRSFSRPIWHCSPRAAPEGGVRGSVIPALGRGLRYAPLSNCLVFGLKHIWAGASCDSSSNIYGIRSLLFARCFFFVCETRLLWARASFARLADIGLDSAWTCV